MVPAGVAVRRCQREGVRPVNAQTDDHTTPALPDGVLGTFADFGFRYALEQTPAAEHVVLHLVNVGPGLTPVADVVHLDGEICGMVTRDPFKGTPDDRKRQWRIECQAILTRAVVEGRL